MRLAPRFVIAFGLLVVASTAGLGLALREERRSTETARFDDEVRSACSRVDAEVRRQAESDRKVLGGACASGELVDRTLLAMEAGDLDERRVALAALVPAERQSFDLDELVLVNGRGDVLGADPRDLIGLSPKEAAAQIEDDPLHVIEDSPPKGATFPSQPSLVLRCLRGGKRGPGVGLLGARHLDPLLQRIGRTVNVSVARGSDAVSTDATAKATCKVGDGHGGSFPIVVSKDKSALDKTLADIDRTIALYGGASAALALLLAVLLARGLSRPLSDLSEQARRVASGDARPVRVRGSGEVAELTRAFDRMLEDLEATRRRLAATTRVAAWREVARRVAHEVKNPLAPIRAAVETLRRLRARSDPAFDEYFDEATRTVLDEVHRIAGIVTEFTAFARLPPPKPQDVDLVDLARGVVKLHEPTAGEVRLRFDARAGVPHVMADRDQIVQVLTNLVQNAIDALRERGKGEVTVRVQKLDGDRVAASVKDDGPGVAPEMVPRLFEPYATSKEHGTGLGLAIAQRIAIEHGGELAYVVPPGGGGAEFRLVLPVEGPPPVSEMPPASK